MSNPQFVYMIASRRSAGEWMTAATYTRGDAIYTSLSAAKSIVTRKRNEYWRTDREFKIQRAPIAAFEDFEGGTEWKTKAR